MLWFSLRLLALALSAVILAIYLIVLALSTAALMGFAPALAALTAVASVLSLAMTATVLIYGAVASGIIGIFSAIAATTTALSFFSKPKTVPGVEPDRNKTETVVKKPLDAPNAIPVSQQDVERDSTAALNNQVQAIVLRIKKSLPSRPEEGFSSVMPLFEPLSEDLKLLVVRQLIPQKDEYCDDRHKQCILYLVEGLHFEEPQLIEQLFSSLARDEEVNAYDFYLTLKSDLEITNMLNLLNALGGYEYQSSNLSYLLKNDAGFLALKSQFKPFRNGSPLYTLSISLSTAQRKVDKFLLNYSDKDFTRGEAFKEDCRQLQDCLTTLSAILPAYNHPKLQSKYATDTQKQQAIQRLSEDRAEFYKNLMEGQITRTSEQRLR